MVQQNLSRPIKLVAILLICRCSPVSLAPWANQGPTIKVELNHTPRLNEKCDFPLFVEFNRKVEEEAKKNLGPNVYDEIIGREFDRHPLKSSQQEFYMDPKDMCIKTDASGNIDLNEFECRSVGGDDPIAFEGTCECGERWSRIDLNDPASIIGLDSSSHSYEYYASNGLNKYLVKQEDPENSGTYSCVANRFGHCTLNEDGGGHVTKCVRKYKCRNITISNPIYRRPFQNPRTYEWYGICIEDDAMDMIKSPFGDGSHISPFRIGIWVASCLVMFRNVQNSQV